MTPPYRGPRRPLLMVSLRDGCTELDQIVAYLCSISEEDVLMDDVELEYGRAEAAAGAEIFAETCEVCHADGGPVRRGSGLFTAATRADACFQEALHGHGRRDDLAREGEHGFAPRSAVERRHSRSDRLAEESGRRVVLSIKTAWPMGLYGPRCSTPSRSGRGRRHRPGAARTPPTPHAAGRPYRHR